MALLPFTIRLPASDTIAKIFIVKQAIEGRLGLSPSWHIVIIALQASRPPGDRDRA